MKTTMDINDELFRSARERAAASGTTLRALVEEGLRRVLADAGEPATVASFKVRVFDVAGRAAGLVEPYGRLGLHHAILDSYRDPDDGSVPEGAVHDRA